MSSPLQTPDFFALEAGEALDGLEMLLRTSREPSPDALLRTVRLLRGSAVLAGQQAIARAAAAFETVARSYRDRPGSWTADMSAQISQAIEEFRLLVRRVRLWDETDTARALRLGRQLELLDGNRANGERTNSGRAAANAGTTTSLPAGVRAFVAREGALIASALDRAARALRVSPNEREPLYTVIRRMQSLRGLAELGELAPLSDILDGIELAIGDLTRMYAAPPGVDDVIEAAAHALTRVSRDVAESGQPDAESAETRRFTELLVRVFAIERDVVPIEALYVDHDPEPMRQPAAAVGFHGPEPLGPLELVSQGEHLCQTAERLTNATTTPERHLRLYQLLGTFRSAGAADPDPVTAALGVFARAIRGALAASVAEQETPQLAACLCQAGELLRSVADRADRALVSRRLLDVAHQLDQIRRPDSEGRPGDDLDVVPIQQLLLADSAGDGELPVVPIEQLLLKDSPTTGDTMPIVPIGQLLFSGATSDSAELPIVSIESLAPDTTSADTPETADTSRALERTFRTYERLLRERPDALPSLTAFLHPSSTDSADGAVAIGDLCYRGRAALERAAAVRQQLAVELAGAPALSAIRSLLDELLDLVPLALTEH